MMKPLIHFLCILLFLSSGLAVGQDRPDHFILATKTPASVDEVLATARTLYGEGDLEQAILYLRSQLKQFPKSLEMRDLLIQFYLENENLNGAIEILQTTLQLRPEESTRWARLGELYTWSDQQDKAILAYEQALRLEPRDIIVLKKLRQLYSWNERETDAFEVEKQILELEPDNAALWKEHGIHARWLNKNREAIKAFQNWLVIEPNNKEALFLLGETFLWENEPQKAEICLQKVVQIDPGNDSAWFYLGQINQWDPFRWWDAKQYYEKVMQLKPDHQDAQKALMLLRQTYGPLWENRASHIEDSNHLGKTEVTSEYSRYVSAHYRMSLAVLFRDLRETKSARRLAATGRGFQLKSLWHQSRKTRFLVHGGLINSWPGGSFWLTGAEWQQTISDQNTFPGHWYSALSFQLDQVLDGVLAIHNKISTKRLRHTFYWELFPFWRIGTELSYSWYSDQNEKFLTNFFNRLRIWKRIFQLYFDFLYSLEDTKLFYPDALPYWTPQNFWTRSQGLTLSYSFHPGHTLEAGYALTVQSGNEFANNWNIRYDFQISPFLMGFFHYQDFGSTVYSFESLQFGIQYRF